MSDPFFATPITNPYQLADVGSWSKPIFVDIDRDGDLDMFVGNSAGNILFFQNTGSAITPGFAVATTNPYSLTNVGGYSGPNFVDIDGDGDLDMFVGNSAGNILFFQNTSTTITPAFAAATTNPYSLTIVGSYSKPNLVDIDGDGDLDMFVGGGGTGGTTFFRNIGSAFSPLFNSEGVNPFGLTNVGSGTYAVPTLVDIDGDSDFDALIGDTYGNTVLFRNNGSVTIPAFAAGVTNPFGLTDVGQGSTPTFVDINGDGNLDAFSGESNGNILLALNVKPEISRARYDLTSGSLVVTGTGFLAAPGANNDIDVSKLTITGQGGATYTLTSANVEITSAKSFTVILNATDKAALNSIVNKTGNQSSGGTIYNLAAAEDWAAGAISAVVVADLTGNGISAFVDPIFATAQTNPFALIDVGSSAVPTFVDIDGDGKIDALIGNSDGNTLYFKNTGTNSVPVFSSATANPFGLIDVGSFSKPTLVDIDGDGDLDALIGNSAGNTLYFKNISTTPVPVFAAAETNPFSLINVGGSARPTFVDINGDGKLDALIGNSAGNTLYFKNISTTTVPVFAAAVTNPFGLTNVGSFSKPTLVDIDGDGKLDALIGNSAGNTLLFRNTGTTTAPAFAAAVTNPFGLTAVGGSASPTFVDINGDGKLDALIGNNAGNTLFFNNIVPSATTTRNDFNGDKKSDILWRKNDGTVALWQMDGSTVTTGSYVTPTLDSTWKIAGVADFSGDGKADILWRNDNNTTVIWKMDGATVTTGSYLTPTLDSSWKVTSTGDFDGDGKADILWRKDDGTTALWKMDGATVVSGNYLTAALDSSWKVASTGDFDGDKKADILWRKDDGTTALWKMDGATVVSGSYVTPTLGNSWKVASTGDFDGDGKADILWRNDDGTTALWKMDGATLVSGNYLSAALDSGWKVAGTADFNGDGKADILWRNDNGTTAEWQMNGATVVAGNYLTPTLDNSWQVAAPIL